MTVEILVLAFGAIVAAGLLIFILQPIWESSIFVGKTIPLREDDLDELYARRDAIYQALKDLQMDHAVGKISDEDYKEFSLRLKHQAADILRKIDEFPRKEASIMEQLEQRIAQLRQEVPVTAPSSSPLPAAVAIPSQSPAVGKRPRFCTQCGAPLRSNDRFCSQCGAPVRRL